MNRYYYFLLFTAIIYLASCQYNPYQQGEELYTTYCSSCHMENGLGLKGLIPPLAGADYIQKNEQALACIIRYGLEEKIEVNGRQYQQTMLGIPRLSDVEINNILNYIKNAWGNDNGHTKLPEVQKQLEQCQEN